MLSVDIPSHVIIHKFYVYVYEVLCDVICWNPTEVVFSCLRRSLRFNKYAESQLKLFFLLVFTLYYLYNWIKFRLQYQIILSITTISICFQWYAKPEKKILIFHIRHTIRNVCGIIFLLFYVNKCYTFWFSRIC